MAQKVVVLIGASYSGLAFAHHLLGTVFPNLPGYDPKSGTLSPYRLVIITPGQSFYGRHGGPRLIADPESVNGGAKAGFVDLKETLETRYKSEVSAAVGALEIVFGTAVAIDKVEKKVGYLPPGSTSDAQQLVGYSALVIASGFRTDVGLYNPLIAGETVDSRVEQMTRFTAAIRNLQPGSTVVVAGSGATGVETAAEIAEIVNPPSPGLFTFSTDKKNATGNVKVVLVTAAAELLSALGHKGAGKTAHGYLERLGVEVRTGVRVLSADGGESGAKESDAVDRLVRPTTVVLDDNSTIDASIYLPCVGTHPNNTFIPAEWLVSGGDEKSPISNTFPAVARSRPGTVKVDKLTCRVEGVNPETEGSVFAIGEIANASSPSLFWIEGMARAAASQLGLEWWTEAVNSANKDKPAKKSNGTPKFGVTTNNPEGRVLSFVPVGKTRGTGVVGRFQVPWMLVWLVKSRDFMIWGILSKVKN